MFKISKLTSCNQCIFKRRVYQDRFICDNRKNDAASLGGHTYERELDDEDTTTIPKWCIFTKRLIRPIKIGDNYMLWV